MHEEKNMFRYDKASSNIEYLEQNMKEIWNTKFTRKF